MSKLIIICGLPGSGKTTLSKKLSQGLNIICIHKDEIKESLFEMMSGKSLEDSRRIGKIAADIFFQLVDKQLQVGVDLIIESPLYFTEDVTRAHNWQKKYDIKIYSVICTIDFEEREKRFRTRNRHHSHFDNERKFGDDEGFDYSGMPGKQIIIETNSPVEKLVKKVVIELESD